MILLVLLLFLNSFPNIHRLSKTDFKKFALYHYFVILQNLFYLSFRIRKILNNLHWILFYYSDLIFPLYNHYHLKLSIHNTLQCLIYLHFKLLTLHMCRLNYHLEERINFFLKKIKLPLVSNFIFLLSLKS
jgi:hypothetical protein